MNLTKSSMNLTFQKFISNSRNGKLNLHPLSIFNILRLFNPIPKVHSELG